MLHYPICGNDIGQIRINKLNELTDFPVNSLFNKLYLIRQLVPQVLLYNGLNGPIQLLSLTVLSLIIFRVEFKATPRLQTAS